MLSFYEIISPENKISHIFGTMHTARSRVPSIVSEEVKQALLQAKVCIFEVDLLQENLQENAQKTLKIQIDIWQRENHTFLQPELVRIVGKAAENLTRDGIHCLDTKIAHYAQNQGKQIRSLETFEEQLHLLYGLGFSPDDQTTILWDLIKSGFKTFFKHPSVLFNPHVLMENYLENDDNDIFKQLNLESMNEVTQTYCRELFPERDLSMALRLEEYLQLGDAFIAVGEGHLKGIASNLKEQGYQVRKIIPSQCVHAIDANDLEAGHKVAAYRKIYEALYNGQRSACKTRDFKIDDIFDYEMAQDYINNNPKKSRPAEAWRLTDLYWNDLTNVELFAAIHKYSHAHSSTLYFFSQTKNFIDGEYTAEKIENVSPGSRSDNIKIALRK